ncbi:MAG: hypothetical protein HOM44_11235 [Gammaproteobacteria bacterium]|jgi:hypothetical protein|nr:hypothetical protein [Gammaproteobacteria bacterium]MBT6889860.1 hypothetical protein [Gammaproteobacteria bacterium]
MTQKPETRTGLFEQKTTNDYVVMWKGREICRYATVWDFVDAHAQGLAALEANQADLLESYYSDL